jgi:hypothetical protein
VGLSRDQGTSPKQLKSILLGLLQDALPELRRLHDLDVERVDRDGGRIFLKDGRVFRVELSAEASIRARSGPPRR